MVLFFDPNSNIIEIFFQYIDLNSDYISIEKNKFYLFIFILTINFCILLFFTSNNKKKYIIKKFFIFDKEKFYKILYINFIIFLFFLLFIIFPEYNNLNEINYRYKLKGLLGYYFYWNIVCFLPTLFLLDKKKILKFLILLSYILAFIIFKIKILILFFGILIFKHFIYYKIVKSQDLLKILLVILSIFLILLFLINFFSWFILELKYQDLVYFNRIFVAQPKNLLIYFDFFSNNETTMLSHIGIINKFTQNNLNIFDLLKNYYKGGSPTSNLYAVEGIASFGIWGIFFSTFLLVSLAKILSYLISEEEEKYLYLSIFFQSAYVINTPFFTNLITYGIGITILLALIKFKKKDENF